MSDVIKLKGTDLAELKRLAESTSTTMTDIYKSMVTGDALSSTSHSHAIDFSELPYEQDIESVATTSQQLTKVRPVNKVRKNAAVKRYIGAVKGILSASGASDDDMSQMTRWTARHLQDQDLEILEDDRVYNLTHTVADAVYSGLMQGTLLQTVNSLSGQLQSLRGQVENLSIAVAQCTQLLNQMSQKFDELQRSHDTRSAGSEDTKVQEVTGMLKLRIIDSGLDVPLPMLEQLIQKQRNVILQCPPERIRNLVRALYNRLVSKTR